MAQRITIDALLGLRQPSIRVPLHLSPDGARLAISVQSKRRDAAVRRERGFSPEGIPLEMVGSRVLIIDTATGAVETPFPATDATSWGAQWSPDGTLLAAYVQQDGPACLGIWQRATRTARLIPQAPVRPFFGFEVPQWTPDSRAVIVKLVPSHQAADHGQGQQAVEKDAAAVTVYSFDPHAQTSAARLPGLTTRYRCDLAKVDAITGEVQPLARDWALTGWRVAPDAGSVAVLRYADADQTRQQRYFDLTILPLGGSEPHVITSHIPQAFGICFNWSPDSRYIAYTTAERGQPDRLFVAPADGSHGPLDLTGLDLTGDGAMDVTQEEAPRWSADGKRIYCPAPGGFWEVAADGSARRRIQVQGDYDTLGWVQHPLGALMWMPTAGAIWQLIRDRHAKNVGLVAVEIEIGKTTLLTEAAQGLAQWAFGVEVAPDGSAIYAALETADHPAEIWRLRADGSEQRRLYALNPSLDHAAAGTGRLIEWRAPDGESRQGTLLLPPDYEGGLPLPVIVSVYGGDFGSRLLHRFGGDECVVHAQLLAARGYAVLFPDLPMEDRDPLCRLPGHVLAAVNCLIDLGIADPQRIGLMGHSYGGYCTLALLTQTNRFRAAVCCAAAVNLTSYYGVLAPAGDSAKLGWAETGQGRMGGSLWEKRDAYIENSPLFYLDRVTTPLLIVSGTARPGEAAQAGEAFSALRRLGKKVEMRLYDGEGHWPGFWSERSVRDLCDSVLRWFDTHLKPADGT